MLSQHSKVYFKPTGGSGGFNIFRITKLESGYQVQHNSVKNQYPTFDALYEQGGQIGYLQPTLSGAGFSKADTERVEAELKTLGKSVGRLFDGCKKGFRELGLDVALDHTSGNMEGKSKIFGPPALSCRLSVFIFAYFGAGEHGKSMTITTKLSFPIQSVPCYNEKKVV
ncbi:hypothetical protein [Paenibacillus sp. MBLB4367]|uniref:hypothetical protein n=1 Tax=Paenibacillus sp. MBLB4367 TaxID=3384767 RepID=UPI00390813EE